MSNVLNLNNTAYEEGYRTFLGDDLGFNDTIHVTYPDIQEMYLLQRSQFWTEKEIDLSRDRADLMSAPKEERDVMLLNLMTQWALDSTASRSIIQIFGRFATCTEVQDLLMVQSFMEGIHARQYSEIIRVCYNNPTQAMQEAADNASVVYRTEIIGKVFNELNRVGAKYDAGEYDLTDEHQLNEIRVALLKGLAVLYGLEAVSFIASFACTFALTRGGKYQGIDKSVGLIAADERLHAEGDRLLFKHLKAEIGNEVFNACKPEMQKIFDAIVSQEFAWAEYIFSEGRSVLGLNTDVLKRYVCHVAKPCFDYLGLQWGYDVVEKNPLPYMDKYFDRGLVQVAPQELELNNYRVASVDSFVEDELDF